MVLIKDTMLLYHTNTQTLSGNKVIAHGDPQLQYLHPNGANRVVTLPAEGDSYGSMFFIVNTSTADDYLSVRNDGGTEIVIIHADGVGLVMCDGSNWVSIFSKTKKGRGSSSFAGNSNARTIAHGLGVTPSVVNVTPTANPGGYLGEVWVTKNATNIYVYNTGTATTAFDWIAEV